VMTGATGPSGSLDCCISLCGCSNSHSIRSPSAMTPRILHQSSSQANMDVYIRARPVARSEARFPPPHQEPGTGARSCPRGPGFLVARAIELAQAYVLDAGRLTASRTTQRTARRRPEPAAVSASDSATTRVPYRRPFEAAMAWSAVS
jgi:hypothetical protein